MEFSSPSFTIPQSTFISLKTSKPQNLKTSRSYITMAPKVLFVLTSANKLANGSPTGWYLPEFAHPYNVLDGKTEITVASPNGGEAPIDPTSVEWFKDDVSVNFLNSKQSLWKNTQKLADFAGKAGSFDAIFFVGGHGRKWSS